MRLHLPGLFLDKRPNGSTRYRVRVEGKKWKKLTLPVGPDHPEFMQHYHAARTGDRLLPQTRTKVIPKSLSWLTQEYVSWMESRVKAGQMHPATLHQRRMFYDRINEKYGNKDMRMPRSKLIEFRDSMQETPGAADNMIKAVRACYKWAIDRELLKENPASNIPRINSSSGATPWSVDDLKQFRNRHALGTTPHLALTLFMFTACRISDAVVLGPTHELTRDGVRHLSWLPGKKGSVQVTVPILPPLERALSAMTVQGPTYLLTQLGKPYASPAAFGNKFRRWVIEAGLSDRSPHGIRKAAGELMALEGATQYHIMAVHGHTQAKTSEVYTSRVNRQRLAAEAMDLLGSMDW